MEALCGQLGVDPHARATTKRGRESAQGQAEGRQALRFQRQMDLQPKRVSAPRRSDGGPRQPQARREKPRRGRQEPASS